MESVKDVRKNVEVNEHKRAYLDLLNEVNGVQLGGNFDMSKVMNSLSHFFYLADRDEPKPVLHENTMKQFGKCPVCNSSVAIQFHSDFCGKCGNRLKWRGEGK